MEHQDADISAPRGVKLGAIVAVAVLHLAVIAALVRAFAPDFSARAVDKVLSTFSVTVRTVEPTPTPEPSPAKAAAKPAGAQGAEGKKVTPREVTAPRPRVVVRPQPPAPQASSSGSANTSGASSAGAGTGAGGTGTGTGSGGAGSGIGGGGGGAAKPVKIAGDINSARDYPVASRDLRIGQSVVIYLTVGTDGRPTACRVARPSRDTDADAITCRLAMERFRFRPARNVAGEPVTATYGWHQRWFYPGK